MISYYRIMNYYYFSLFFIYLLFEFNQWINYIQYKQKIVMLAGNLVKY
jgi:hypothetical protein